MKKVEDNTLILENVFGISWLSFDLSTILMMAIASIIVFVLCVLGAKSLQMRPTGAQNVMEWIVDFVKGLIGNTMDWKTGKMYLPLGLTLLTYILISNILGVITVVSFDGLVWWTSPTADPAATLALAGMVIVLSHYFGIKMQGAKAYGKSFFQPFWLFLPINLVSEFANSLTLGLRLFGNIFAGGVLLGLLVDFSAGHGVLGFLAGIIPSMAWQGFSLFIGGIQAYIFTVLAMVYLSQKISTD